MIKLAFLVLLLVPAMAHAVVCKNIDADGVVVYTDVPAFKCEHPVKLPGYSRHKQRSAQPYGFGADQAATGNGVAFEGYLSIEIVKPEANELVSGNDGRVPLAIKLEPALQEGHRFGIYLDGALIPDSFGGLAIELTGIGPGMHHVRAAVFDARGRRLNDSAKVPFILEKTGPSEGASAPPPLPGANREAVAPAR